MSSKTRAELCEMAVRGGEALKAQKGAEYYREIGRLGGVTKAKNRAARLEAQRLANEVGT